MYKHYIVMSSAFTLGTRIALDYIIEKDSDIEKVKSDMKFIQENAKNDIHLSSHFITTDSKDWESVEKMDAFFSNVKLIKTKEEFLGYIDQDTELKGLDVAKYILSKCPCTHLKLEKLVYFAYADYMVKTGKKLFNDNIFAYKLGPIIESVYKKYKKRRTILFIEEEDDKMVEDETKLTMPLRSRIMSSKDGLEKVFSIDETIAKYNETKAYDLVKITHRKNSPWKITGGYIRNNPVKITDQIIKDYHLNEQN